jgi:uncharacterized protein YndB with AHSA1/START domain
VTQDVVTASIRIRATPDEVFPYLTDPELLPLWLGELADTDPEPGGRFAIDFGDGGKVRGTYVLISPPNRVAFTWGLQGSTVLPEGSSTVEIYLTADGDETIVDLTHRDLPVREQSGHEAGWEMCLAKLSGTATRRSTSG